MCNQVPDRTFAAAKQLDDGVAAGVTEHLERGRCWHRINIAQTLYSRQLIFVLGNGPNHPRVGLTR
jgi:hypothetical protein